MRHVEKIPPAPGEKDLTDDGADKAIGPCASGSSMVESLSLARLRPAGSDTGKGGTYRTGHVNTMQHSRVQYFVQSTQTTSSTISDDDEMISKNIVTKR